MTKVAVIKADTYDELGGIAEFIKPGDKVLIKPNMVDGVKKELSVTTHP
jgi:uncharacterized protein (DUF362 family)